MGKRRWVAVERLARTVQAALEGGYASPIVPLDWRRSNRPVSFPYWRSWLIAVSMDCESPYEYEMCARWPTKANGTVRRVFESPRHPLFVTVRAQCRTCASCRERRKRMWYARAADEFRRAGRTTMGTFTMSPYDHSLIDMEISAGRWCDKRKRWLEEPIALGKLSQEELFRRRASAFGREVTLWLKRVRKALPGQFSYLLVTEVHEGVPGSKVYGFPHYHILLHERQPGTLFKLDDFHRGADGKLYVRDRSLVRKEWNRGHTRFVVCEDVKSVGYLCNYVSKSMMARVRASLNYGRTDTAVISTSGTKSRGSIRTPRDVDPYAEGINGGGVPGNSTEVPRDRERSER